MNRRGILTLLAVAVALGLYYVLAVRDGADVEVDPGATRLVRGLAAGDVATLEIERPDALMAFERTPNGWRMTTPFAERAEESAVVTLVSAFVDATVERRIEHPDAPADYGLDPPAATVVFGAAGADRRVHLGNLTADGEYAYARVGDSTTVVTVAPSVRRYATEPVDAFRARRVVEFALADVTGYTVDTPERHYSWRRGASEWFSASDGDTIVGDVTAVESIPRILRGLRVAGFPAGDTDALFARDVHSVSVSTGDGRITVDVGGPVGDGFAVRVSGEDRVVQVDSTVLLAFEPTAFDLRERRILEFSPQAAQRITLYSPELSVTIVRAGDRWVHPNPALGDVNSDRAHALVTHLLALRFTRIDADAPRGSFGLTDPNLSVTILGSDGAVVDRMDCHQLSDDPSVVYVTSRSSDTIGRMSALDVLKLFENFRAVRAP